MRKSGKVQFNCRIPKTTKLWITQQAKRLTRERGTKISQADVVHMLVLASPFNQKDGDGEKVDTQ